MRKLLEVLLSEKNSKNKNGIYHRLQIDFAYNSNHIEGSRLTHDQTRYIFDTKTIDTEHSEDVIRVNDVIETINHFKCFDHIIDTVHEPLTEDYIKALHGRLKAGILYDDDDVVVGDYKRYPNEVGFQQTVEPERVSDEIRELIGKYGPAPLGLYEIAAFHAGYERIHPFYDGNGRTGRLIMFKQCLENNIVPFFIDEFSKLFYYKGLEEWNAGGSDERLINVFLAGQDDMEKLLKYFHIDFTRQWTDYKSVKVNRAVR